MCVCVREGQSVCMIGMSNKNHDNLKKEEKQKQQPRKENEIQRVHVWVFCFVFVFVFNSSFFDKVFGLHLLDVEFKLLFCFSSLCRRVLIGMCANQIRLFVIWKKGERKKRIKALKKEELNLGGFLYISIGSV